MAESTLSPALLEIKRSVARELGWARDPASWTADQITDFADFFKAGLRKFCNPPVDPRTGAKHRWSFLYPRLSVTTQAPYSTGTIVIVDGVVTLTSGTWPSWAAAGELLAGGREYSVASRDSGSQITLDDTTVDLASGASYSLVRASYALPDDFAGIEGPLTYSPGDAYLAREIQVVNDLRLRQERRLTFRTGYPQWCAIRTSTFAAATGERWEIHLFPIPNATYHLEGRYLKNLDTITNEAYYLAGGMPHGQTILAAVLSAATLALNDNNAKWESEFQARLMASLAHDRQEVRAETLGLGIDATSEFDSGNYSLPRQPRNLVRYDPDA